MAMVLIVEDDRDIAEMVELYLRTDGHRTERAHDGPRALELWRAARPDLILLDIGLPGVDGLEVLRRVRSDPAGAGLPVLMLTARAEEVDEVLGLSLGADDYITKPFSPRTLLARVRSALRRTEAEQGGDSRPIRLGELTVDPYGVRALIGERDLGLTPTEFRILRHLARTPGRAVSRPELLEVAMPESDALERAVDAHVKNLRQKLADGGGADLVQTVRGMGYRLVDGA